MILCHNSVAEGNLRRQHCPCRQALWSHRTSSRFSIHMEGQQGDGELVPYFARAGEGCKEVGYLEFMVASPDRCKRAKLCPVNFLKSYFYKSKRIFFFF